MTTKTEGKYPGEFLLTEAVGQLSRDTVTVTVPANTAYQPGQVLGRLSGSGKYIPYDDANSDGSEDAAGILYGDVSNDTGAPVDVKAAIINCLAEVSAAGLVWAEGVSVPAGTADLKALFIKAR